MKATELLEAQHRTIEELFLRLEDGHSNVLHELADNLVAHMMVEQEIFYPAVSSVDPNSIAESFEEHATAEISLKRLLRTEGEEEPFNARLSVLKELVTRHVDEEEGDLFPDVEQDIAEDRLEKLGMEMKARFDEILAQGHRNVLPEGMDETTSDRALIGEVGEGQGRALRRGRTLGSESEATPDGRGTPSPHR
jgi:hemerythrin-like domain-containing protein